MTRTFKLNNYSFINDTGIVDKLLKDKKSNQRILMLTDNTRRIYHGLVNSNDLLPICNKHNYNICELITDFPCRVYFDIDGKPDLKLDDVKNIIMKYFGNVKLYIMGYEAPEKHSYHITLNSYITSTEDLLFLKNIVKHIKNNDCDSFDSCVYHKNRAMKCIGQSKPDGHQQLPISGTNGEKKFFIGSFIPDDVASFDNQNLPDISRELKNTISSLPTQIFQLPCNITNEDLTKATELLNLTPLYDTINTHGYRWDVMRFCYYNGISLKDYLEWFAQSNPKPDRVTKLKTCWDTMKNFSPYTMTQYRRKLSQFYPEMIEENIHTSKFLSMFDLTKYKNKQIGRIEPKHYEVKNKVLVFNIGMGGGKTTTTLQYLKRHNEKSFVWLAPRQTLVLNTSHRMTNEYNIDHVTHLDAVEKKKKGDMLKTAERLIICNQSLHYLSHNQDFKIVVIDEIETVINSWKDDETHKDNLGRNFKMFIEILRRAEKIILLDAFTTTKTFDLLESLGITDIRMYSSEYRPVQKTLKHYSDQDALVMQICNEITNGKKLYIFYAFKNGTSKRRGIQDLDQRIKGHYNALKGCEPTSILYFAESTAKNQLGNINESWAKANYVITTSSITVGVNYEGKDFDKVYLFCSGYANQPRDIIQSSMRVRYPKESEFGIYFFDHTNDEMTKYPAYYTENKCPIYNKLVDGVIDELQCDFDDSLRKFCDLTNYKLGDVKKVLNKNKNKNITNEYFESKMLLEYSKVPVYDGVKANDAEANIYNRTATLEEHLALDRYYFDHHFKTYNEEDRKYIWNENQRKFFKNINNPFIQLIEKVNGCRLYNIKLNDIQVDDEILNYLTTNYKIAKKSNNNLLIVKAINEILGGMIQSKKSKTNQHRGFEFTEEFTTNVKIMLTVELEQAKNSIKPVITSDLDQGLDMTTDDDDGSQRYHKLKEQYDLRYPFIDIMNVAE
jgi:hypothetical protein